MVDRNTIVGLDFLTIGLVLSALGYIGVQSVPIAALGFAIAVIGALVLLIVPESVPQDAFRSLLKDSITNMEIILEETQLQERAYFVPIKTKDEPEGQVRAFIPLDSKPSSLATSEGASSLNTATLLENVNKAPRRFIVNYGDLRGLLLVPPGNEIVRLAKVQEESELEESLRSVLVDFSDLASSVLVVEEGNKVEEDVNQGALNKSEIEQPKRDLVKIQIKKPALSSESPFFNECLGTPVSCVAACVVSAARGLPVKIIDEKFDPALIRLTLEVID